LVALPRYSPDTPAHTAEQAKSDAEQRDRGRQRRLSRVERAQQHEMLWDAGWVVLAADGKCDEAA
jgi:hypothetical protein